MHPIRLAFASFACAAALGTQAALANDLCDKVDALIISGQHIVPFNTIVPPRPDDPRNDTVQSGDALLGLFSQCTLVDSFDDAFRLSSSLTCTLIENDGEPVTEASRADFLADELARLEEISVCLAMKDGWSMYGDVMEGEFTAYLNDWAEVRPEDAIGAELSVLQLEETPLVNAQLRMELQTDVGDVR
ncbi:MAG: hypothetical protein RLO80_05625 [Hyphomonas sp.]